jgi:hypothetical protein
VDRLIRQIKKIILFIPEIRFFNSKNVAIRLSQTSYEIAKEYKLRIHYNILQDIYCIYIRSSILRRKHETETRRTIVLQLLLRRIYTHGLDKKWKACIS